MWHLTELVSFVEVEKIHGTLILRMPASDVMSSAEVVSLELMFSSKHNAKYLRNELFIETSTLSANVNISSTSNILSMKSF